LEKGREDTENKNREEGAEKDEKEMFALCKSLN
jgi:hypothetical protein